MGRSPTGYANLQKTERGKEKNSGCLQQRGTTDPVRRYNQGLKGAFVFCGPVRPQGVLSILVKRSLMQAVRSVLTAWQWTYEQHVIRYSRESPSLTFYRRDKTEG